GSTTRVLTGDETGVIYAADAASATTIANGEGDAPSSFATASATGAINTAVAVFDTNSPSMAVTANSAARSPYGPTAPVIIVNPRAARSTPPVRCNARENGIMPTISTRLCQWIES